MDFASLGLSASVLQATQDLGFKEPTPIQAQAIPIALSGKDIIGSAQTGTGKTAAFALPILQHLEKPGKLRALILEPTRELADQVCEALQKFSKHTGLRINVLAQRKRMRSTRPFGSGIGPITLVGQTSLLFFSIPLFPNST